MMDLSLTAQKNIFTKNKLHPPRSWLRPSLHYLEVINNPWYKLIFKLQSLINYYTYLFYQSRDIYSATLPITTGSISSPMGLGSDSLPVNINLAGQDTYLADSMQFMLEYALRFHKNGVFYVMPSFRGEDADYRHLCQFYHSEAEIQGSLEDIIKLVEEYIKYLAQAILDSCSNDLQSLGFNINHILQLISLEKIPQIRYEKALDLLSNDSEFITEHSAGFKIINSKGENQLNAIFSGPVWLTHLPQLSVPFYQADEEGTKYAKCADLIMGIGETVGAGERHENFVSLLNAMQMRQVSAKPYEWYVKMREISPMKTSGFGMGIERFILWILDHNDIRDCQIIPRFNGINFIP